MSATAAHVAVAPVAALLREMPQALRWLGPAEAARLAAIRSSRRSEHFLAGRWLARQVLAAAYGRAAQDWAIDAPQQGAPCVIGAGEPHLAISHSAAVAACAAADAPIGLDIEMPVRERDIAGLATLCCTPQERALLDASADARERVALFYAMWTAKEAWIKRRGESIAPRRLQQIALAAAQAQAKPHVQVWAGDGWTLALAAEPGATVHWHSATPAATATWSVRDAA
jgi:4'-phosphopantetheinyl transferase